MPHSERYSNFLHTHTGYIMIVFNNVRCHWSIAVPGNYLDDWPLLWQAGFGFVDIILPVSDDLTS